jgi:hypothetical protein
MVQEWNEGDFGGKGQVEYAEHSSKSGAKKVVALSPDVPAVEDGVGANKIARWKKGEEGATGAPLVLEPKKAYRVISSVACYLVLWNDDGSGATPPVAGVGDFYLPANTPTVIATKSMNTLESTAVAGAGLIQAVEVA